MARPKGSKNKKTKAKKDNPMLLKEGMKIEKVEISPNDAQFLESQKVQDVKPYLELDDSGLEDSPFFSIDEAARFLGVEERCARLWFEHGKLSGKEDHGFKRVSRASILRVKGSNLMK